MPRRYALLPILIGGCYMPLGQSLVIGGLNFYLLRILILFAMARIAIRGELFTIRLNSFDGIVLAWLTVSSFLYIAVDGSYVAPTERLGYFYDAFGIYVFVRSSIRTLEESVLAIKMCSLLVIPLAVLFVIEYRTSQNPFAVLGAPVLSEIRNGRVRCQGPFKHSILAGTFGASCVPLFWGLLLSSRRRLLPAAGLLAALTIVVTSASSGPLSALGISGVALGCWYFRAYTRAIRWGIVAFLAAIAAVMKAPIWFLIDRLSGLIGGEGYYRSALIDAAVRHFDEWWLIGTGYTVHWMPTGIPGDEHSADLVNEFVAQAVQGGLLALVLFIWIIVKCFKSVGRAVRLRGVDDSHRFIFWSLGCAMVAHVASFFSVTYFDQIIIYWYALIAMIAVLPLKDVEPALSVATTAPVEHSRPFAHFRARIVPAAGAAGVGGSEAARDDGRGRRLAHRWVGRASAAASRAGGAAVYKWPKHRV